jgi:hypothetical protein
VLVSKLVSSRMSDVLEVFRAFRRTTSTCRMSRLTRKCPSRPLSLPVLRSQGPVRRRQRVGSARHTLAVALPDGYLALAVARIPRDGTNSRLWALLRIHRRSGGRRDGRGQQAVAVGAGEGGMCVRAPLGRLRAEEGGGHGAIVASPALGAELGGHCWRVGGAPS